MRKSQPYDAWFGTPRQNLALALVAVAFLAPLVAFWTDAQVTSVDVTVGFIGLAAMLAGTWLLLDGRAAWPSSRLSVAWLAFISWTLAGTIASDRSWSAFMGQPGSHLGWAMFVAFTVLVLAFRDVADESKTLIVRAAPFFLLAQAIAVFVQAAGGHSMPRGTLPNSTYLGELVLLLLPFAVRPSQFDEEKPWIAVAMPVVIISALAASGSRVATVIAVAWAVWTFGRSKRMPARMRRSVVALVLLGVVLGGMFFAREEILGSATAGSLGQRPGMLHVAAAAVLDRPILGWGMEGFSTGGSAVSTVDLAKSGPMVSLQQGFSGDPHNIFANVLVSSGLVGFALFVWALVELVLRWRAMAREKRLDAASVWALAGLFAVIFTAPATAHVIPLLAAVTAISVGGPSNSRAQSKTTYAMGLGMLAAAIAISAIFSANRLSHLPYDRYDEQVSPRLASGSQRMADLWRCDPQLYYLTSMHWGYAGKVDPVVSLNRPDLTAVRRAAELEPSEPYYRLELARTLKYYGESPAVVDKAFADTFAVYPLFPIAHAEYAKYLADQGRYEEAKSHLELARMVPDVEGSVGSVISETEQQIWDAEK